MNVTKMLRDNYPGGEFVLVIPQGEDGHRQQRDVQARIVHIRQCALKPVEMYAETEIHRSISAKSDEVRRFLRVKIHTQPLR
jgi:hypothetical protein